ARPRGRAVDHPPVPRARHHAARVAAHARTAVARLRPRAGTARRPAGLAGPAAAAHARAAARRLRRRVPGAAPRRRAARRRPPMTALPLPARPRGALVGMALLGTAALACAFGLHWNLDAFASLTALRQSWARLCGFLAAFTAPDLSAESLRT